MQTDFTGPPDLNFKLWHLEDGQYTLEIPQGLEQGGQPRAAWWWAPLLSRSQKAGKA